MRRTLGACLVVGTLGSLLPAARANLLQSLGSGSLSSLSVQVLAKPRSAAGRKKNVWDADPPETATSGSQYFLYDVGPDGHALPPGQQPATFNAVVAGPGYNVTAQVLVSDPTGTFSGGRPFFLGIPTSTDPDNPENFYDLSQLGVSGFVEYGVVALQFTLSTPSAAGQISGSTDSAELGYDGARDDNGRFVRGDEQARVFTSTVAGHDDDAITGVMTAAVPSDFIPGYPMEFAPGYLTFQEGTFTGSQIMSASVTIPEPASLAGMALAGTLLTRRRSR